jgi:uncharacterized protein YcfJ
MTHRAKPELKGHDMQRIFTKKSPNTLIWAAGIAMILFCIAGLAALMGWIPNPIGSPSGDAKITAASEKPLVKKAYKAAVQTISNGYIKPIGDECGAIASARQINANIVGSSFGVVGGAVICGVLSHRVGGGRGKHLATLAGGVGGAMATTSGLLIGRSGQMTEKLNSQSSLIGNAISDSYIELC